jgi:N-acetylglucosaminyl-diphospho-decaprenol L-rhamnosyltransferase
MEYQDLTIVITTFHSQDKIYKCLDSIDKKINIIIVENTNNHLLKNDIQSKYKNTRIILTGENLGYAKGNNLGLTKVKSKYALILNPDVIVEKETFANFFSLIKKKPDFAIMAPAIQNENNYLKEKFENKNLVEVGNVKGFAMFFNMVEFKNIGFFDENFFIYLEETDLCKRLKNNGKKIYVDSQIKFFHLGGSSHNESINFEMELSRNWHWMWSTFYYNKKHYGYFYALIKTFKKLLSSSIKSIFYFLTFNSNKKKIYFQRFNGLINSMLGKKSWYRPKILVN